MGDTMRGLFLDFEATDKDVATARITQVAFSIWDTDKQKEDFHYSSLILPEGEYEIHETAAKITGISKEQLEQFGRPLVEALDVLGGHLVGVDFLAAHNLHNYDLPLLKNEMLRIGREMFQLPQLVDTRFDVPWPDHIETRKLTYLAAEFGIVNPSAHSARHDVDLMAKLFFSETKHSDWFKIVTRDVTSNQNAFFHVAMQCFFFFFFFYFKVFSSAHYDEN